MPRWQGVQATALHSAIGRSDHGGLHRGGEFEQGLDGRIGFAGGGDRALQAEETVHWLQIRVLI